MVIEAAELADEGGSVPAISIGWFRRVNLFADASPNPGSSIVSFGRLATVDATMRIRLVGSQNLVAVAEIVDGTFCRTSRPTAATEGGCG